MTGLFLRWKVKFWHFSPHRNQLLRQGPFFNLSVQVLMKMTKISVALSKVHLYLKMKCLSSRPFLLLAHFHWRYKWRHMPRGSPSILSSVSMMENLCMVRINLFLQISSLRYSDRTLCLFSVEPIRFCHQLKHKSFNVFVSASLIFPISGVCEKQHFTVFDTAIYWELISVNRNNKKFACFRPVDSAFAVECPTSYCRLQTHCAQSWC